MNRLAILALSALLTLTACSTTTNTGVIVADVGKTGNVMLDLREDYELARYQLEMSIDRFPTDVGVKLLDLEDEIATYINDVQRKWKADELSTLMTIDSIYYEGAQLYSQGVVLITPYVDTLEPAARERLKALADTVSRVDVTYHNLRADLQNAAHQAELAQQSIELMTMLLRLGLMAK